MANVLFKGPIYNNSGYAQLRNLCFHLSKHNNVRIEPYKTSNPVKILNHNEISDLEKTILDKKCITITTGIAPQIRPDIDASYNIAYSMFETNVIPDNWIKFYNEFDEVWVPSTFCEKAFDRRSLKCVVRVVPFGINLETFSKCTKKCSSIFTFLSVGTWIDRKGWDILINAYTSEFIGNFQVKLCIKTDESIKTKEEMIKEYLTSNRTANMPRILINTNKLDEDMMVDIYSEADCYISTSRGEAFGVPFLEAMSCGIPVIGGNFGGQTDFISEKCGWFLSIKTLKQMSDRLCGINAAYKNLWFAEPDVKDVREMMRYAYEHRNEIKEKGEFAKLQAQNWTWKKSAEIANNRLSEIWSKIK
jgi:glycosyltransferase involved in cell wall biosynthesis